MPSIALADMHVAKDHTEKKLHVTTQIASYATEMLANSSQRLHAINLTVIGKCGALPSTMSSSFIRR